MSTQELITFVQSEISKSIDLAAEEVQISGSENAYEIGTADGFVVGATCASVLIKDAILKYESTQLLNGLQKEREPLWSKIRRFIRSMTKN